MPLRVGSLLAAVLVLAGGCARPPVIRELQGVERETLPIGPGLFGGVAWLPGDEIVVSYGPGGLDSNRSEMWSFGLETGEWRPLVEGSDLMCSRVSRLAPIALDRDRVAFARDCYVGGVDPLHLSIQVYDLERRSVTELVPGPLGLGFGTFTWSTRFDRGFYGEASAPCVSIVGLTPRGRELLPLTVSAGGENWRLDAKYHDPNAPCEGLASWPDWQPTGRQLAFFGLPPGESGWSIFLTDALELRPLPVFGPVADAHVLEWSPDGRRLAFTGGYAGRNGIWILHVASGAVGYIDHQFVEDMAWSPAGDALVATVAEGLRSLEDDPPVTTETEEDFLRLLDNQVMIFRVPRLEGSPDRVGVR